MYCSAKVYLGGRSGFSKRRRSASRGGVGGSGIDGRRDRFGGEVYGFASESVTSMVLSTAADSVFCIEGDVSGLDEGGDNCFCCERFRRGTCDCTCCKRSS